MTFALSVSLHVVFVCMRLCEAITSDMQFAGAHVTIFSLMPARAAAANTNMTLKAARSCCCFKWNSECGAARGRRANKAEKRVENLKSRRAARHRLKVSAPAIWYLHLSICDCQIRWLRKTKARAIKAVAPRGWESEWREAIKCHLGTWQLLLSVNSISALRSQPANCQMSNLEWSLKAWKFGGSKW